MHVNPDKIITFLECLVIFLLITNAVSLVTACVAIGVVRLERKPIKLRHFGEVRRVS